MEIIYLKNGLISLMNLRDSFFHLYHGLNALEFQTNSKRSGDLTYRDLMYINLIMFMDDCTVTKLAKLMNLSKPAVTMRVNRLIEQGLIIKQKSKNDERVNILMLSPETYTRFGDNDKRINHALVKICEEYPAEDVKTFANMMDRLADLFSDPNI